MVTGTWVRFCPSIYAGAVSSMAVPFSSMDTGLPTACTVSPNDRIIARVSTRARMRFVTARTIDNLLFSFPWHFRVSPYPLCLCRASLVRSPKKCPLDMSSLITSLQTVNLHFFDLSPLFVVSAAFHLYAGLP